MKNQKLVQPFLVAEQELRRCKDQAGLSEFLFSRIVIFSVILLLFGIQGLINDLAVDMGRAVNVVMILVFLGGWIWFSAELRKGRKKFC